MSSQWFFVVVIGGLVVLMATLSLFESAVVGARRWQVRDAACRGDLTSRTILPLVENSALFVNSMRMGIILVATTAGVFSGTLICRLLEHTRPEPAAWAGFRASGVAIGITLAIMFFGDLLPRKIGRLWSEPIARGLARPLSFYLRVASPLAAFLDRLIELLTSALGGKLQAETPVTHEEIKELIWEGAQAGVFDAAEHEIFKRVFRFCERRARALMTPRDQVVWIDVSDSPEEIRHKVLGCSHTRFPVCDESLDNLLGIVQIKDLLRENAGGASYRVKGHLTVPALIYEGARGPKVLEILRNSSTHTAMVLDEFGSVVGMLTLTDILGAVLGDVPEQGREEEEPRAVQREDGSWLLDGLLPIDAFRDLFDLGDSSDGNYQTLAGFVVTHLGHIPRSSEHFDWLGLRIEIVDMDAQRVDRVLVSRLPTAEPLG